MLMVIVGGVGLACVKEGKGVDINMMAFGIYVYVWVSFVVVVGGCNCPCV